jgi:hypothetical protein
MDGMPRLDAEMIRQKLSEGLIPREIAQDLGCRASAVRRYRQAQSAAALTEVSPAT